MRGGGGERERKRKRKGCRWFWILENKNADTHTTGAVTFARPHPGLRASEPCAASEASGCTMWQPSAYASPSPSPSQRPRSARAGTPNNNNEKHETALAMQLAVDGELTAVDTFWDRQMTAFTLKVEKAKAATVARHAEVGLWHSRVSDWLQGHTRCRQLNVFTITTRGCKRLRRRRRRRWRRRRRRRRSLILPSGHERRRRSRVFATTVTPVRPATATATAVM
jgi:hypothetical protein